MIISADSLDCIHHWSNVIAEFLELFETKRDKNSTQVSNEWTETRKKTFEFEVESHLVSLDLPRKKFLITLIYQAEKVTKSIVLADFHNFHVFLDAIWKQLSERSRIFMWWTDSRDLEAVLWICLTYP